MRSAPVDPGGPAIAVANLVKRFDAVVAVDDISFSVARGSVTPGADGIR